MDKDESKSSTWRWRKIERINEGSVNDERFWMQDRIVIVSVESRKMDMEENCRKEHLQVLCEKETLVY